MSKISLTPNASGTGNFTIASPNSNTDRTLTLPDQTGTVLTGSGAIGVNASAPASSVNIDSSGNVGIGTTSPAYRLQTFQTGGASITALFQTDQTDSYISFRNTTNASNSSTRIGAAGNDISFLTASSERMRIDSSGNLQFNSGYGSAVTAYGCRAWVKFNGTGTPAINGSGNVTSITDNGTGDYTINFTTALADTNYSVVLGNNYNGTGAFAVINPNTPIYSTTQVKIQVVDRNGSAQDTSILNAAILR